MGRVAAVDERSRATRTPRTSPDVEDPPAYGPEVAAGSSATRRVAAAVLVCATSLALAGVGLALVGTADSPGEVYRFWQEAAAAAVAFSAVGCLITVRRPDHLVGWLFAGLGLLTSVQLVTGQLATAAAASGSGVSGLAPLSALVQGLAVAGLVLLVLLFPTGALPSRTWRPVLWLAAAGFGTAAVAQAVGPDRLADFGGLANPAHVPVAASWRGSVAVALALLCGLGAAGAVAALLFRLRTASARERSQLKWFVWAIVSTAVVLLAGDALVPGAGDYAWLLGPPAVAAAAAVAVLRYDLYDIDLIIRRSCVLAVLTILLAVGYVAVVHLVAALLPAADGRAPSLLATAVVAVAFAPLRERVQRLVDRRLFGQRNDPYAALTSLAEQLHHAPTPEDVLQVAVTMVARAVRSPFAVVHVRMAGHEHVSAACGEQRPVVLRLPLTYQAEDIGYLAVAARSGERGFSGQDLRLLTELAHQVAMAAHAVALSRALQRSREQLVTAREEERRRLRRDLHDGLGPTLTGVSLLADAARSAIRSDPVGAERRLRELRAETKGAIESIRRLVYDLRPPALDELGLVEALREQTRRIQTEQDGNSLQVSVTADELPPLSAAIEVAVYRIVSEAVTNVVRHARARQCRVHLGLGDDLQVVVTDDGAGMPAAPRAGVGLTSMRERVSELGGRLTIEADGRGTAITAELPVSRT